MASGQICRYTFLTPRIGGGREREKNKLKATQIYHNLLKHRFVCKRRISYCWIYQSQIEQLKVTDINIFLSNILKTECTSNYIFNKY